MVATRNACAGWMTCENCTGHWALSIARSLRAIGWLVATVSGSSSRICLFTANLTPNYCRVVAASLSDAPRACKHFSPALRTCLREDTAWQAAKRLQLATDRCGDGAEARNQIGKNFRRQRLIAIAFG